MEKITVGVDGMMCGHCEAHVNDAVRNALKVKKVTSSHSKKETVIIAEEGLTDEQIKSVIDATGYTVTGISREPYADVFNLKLFDALFIDDCKNNYGSRKQQEHHCESGFADAFGQRTNDNQQYA